MKRIALIALLPLALMATACAQDAPADTDREDRILANLRYEFPQLQEANIEIREIESSGIAGVDRGVFVINNQQEQIFLITEDDTRLYLVIADPIDASRDAEALASAEQERLEEAAQEAAVRGRELSEMFANLPVRGSPDAPVTIVEFSDFQCSFCARVFSTVHQLIENNPDQVRLIYAQYPLPNHQWAEPAAIASLCVAQQDEDAFWTLHDRYFEHQREMTPANVIERSRQWVEGTGVDAQQWQTCVEDEGSAAHREARAELQRHMEIGSELGVRGTPAFFINGQFVSGAQPLEVFQSYVDAAAE